MCWVIVALNDEDVSDMRIAMKKILEDVTMIKLFDPESSYLRKNKAELFEALDVLQ